jgi:hypothetical protein
MVNLPYSVRARKLVERHHGHTLPRRHAAYALSKAMLPELAPALVLRRITSLQTDSNYLAAATRPTPGR